MPAHKHRLRRNTFLPTKLKGIAMMNEKNRFSYLFGSNAPYIEELYEAY